MTIDTQKLSQDIARVMDTPCFNGLGEACAYYDLAKEALRQQGEVIRELVKTSEKLRQHVSATCDYLRVADDLAAYRNALALSAPLVEENIK